MPTRREFIQNAAALTGLGGVFSALPASIQKALAIEPEKGSTYLDAEHVVILMQENRSFDHCFGTLRGVRGFNDPRAITLADQNPVWVQPNAAGERYAPFRLNIKETKSTWMGSLPHGWTDQVDARNHGQYNRWLSAKRSGRREYATMPLTMGHYTREDIPFYYALADAFTICDQHFCSSLTGTTPNRLYLWTGTIREKPSADSIANVENSDVDYGKWANWKTFPDRLEDHGVSWKIYQNELSLESGLGDDEDSWLSNFTDNPIEWFRQFQVLYAATHREYVERSVKTLPGEIADLKKKLESTESAADKAALKKRVDNLAAKLKRYEAEIVQFTAANFDKLSPREKNLHAKAFSTNTGDPSYRQLAEITYKDGDVERRVKVPKGDVLHQFRQDVKNGTLPTVSWLVSPSEFSDHPGSAWYGAWYLSEVLDILTSKPEVWKKTVFILTYDENDGYFDHVPPFVAPHPRKPETGRMTKGIDASVEFVELEQDRKRKAGRSIRESSIGLGYRVPMIVASPWSRGGCVCSQVFDHTSVLQFLEKLVTHRTGKKIEESNISQWRRAVCGDLTSVFQSPADLKPTGLTFLTRDAVVESIHRAKFKGLPSGYKALTEADIEQIRRDPRQSPLLPKQEPGTRRSCPLPYELSVNGSLNGDRSRFGIRFEALKKTFGDRAAGSPFTAYAMTKPGAMTVRNYAVESGASLDDSWALADFEGGRYLLRVSGPNGFFREYRGSSGDPNVGVKVEPTPDGMEIVVTNHDSTRARAIEVRDNTYGNASMLRELSPGATARLTISTESSHGWYDASIRVAGAADFEQRCAGRVEFGDWSVSDPAMA